MCISDTILDLINISQAHRSEVPVHQDNGNLSLWEGWQIAHSFTIPVNGGNSSEQLGMVSVLTELTVLLARMSTTSLHNHDQKVPVCKVKMTAGPHFPS